MKGAQSTSRGRERKNVCRPDEHNGADHFRHECRSGHAPERSILDKGYRIKRPWFDFGLGGAKGGGQTLDGKN